MKACYISTHNKAGLSILKALERGSQGACFCLCDVTSAADAPAFSSGSRVPQWMVPGVDEETLNKLRADAVRISTLPRGAPVPLTPAERAEHIVDVIEFGYCSDTRMTDKIAEKQRQHEQLLRLRGAGWKEVRLYVFPLGTLGAIHKSSLTHLVELGLQQAAATKLLSKLSRHAVYAAQGIVRKKRELEQELWGGPQQHEGRRGVG